jgi:hypothetical protein
VNGIQPSSSNYAFRTLYVSGSGPSSWALNADFSNSASVGGSVIFHYGYIQ